MKFARALAMFTRPALIAVSLTAIGVAAWWGAGSLTGSNDPAPLIAPAGAGPHFVFTEFGVTADTVWVASAADPGDRRAIATIAHAEGFGVYAALSPDGQRIAYTVVPPVEGKPSADSPAELRIIQADTGDQLVAVNADLLITPVWAPDSSSVVIRRSIPAENRAGAFALISVDLDGREEVIAAGVPALFPIGFAGDTLYYASVSPDGTDLYRLEDGEPAYVARLSDDIARDWQLSPDGRSLAYLVLQEREPGRLGFTTQVLGLTDKASGEFAALASRDASAPDEFGPLWQPGTGALTLGRLEESGASAVVAVSPDTAEAALSAADSGFDVPLSWSPDGAYLVVRSFSGSSADDPGTSRVYVLAPDGTRAAVSASSDVQIIGWLPAANGEGAG